MPETQLGPTGSMNPLLQHIKSLYQPFIMGGVTVALIKLLGNRVSPVWASVFGAFPLGMMSSATIESDEKFKAYLHNYPIMLCASMFAMGTYNYVYHKLKLPRPEALKRAFTAWFIAAVIFSRTLLKT